MGDWWDTTVNWWDQVFDADKPVDYSGERAPITQEDMAAARERDPLLDPITRESVQASAERRALEAARASQTAAREAAQREDANRQSSGAPYIPPAGAYPIAPPPNVEPGIPTAALVIGGAVIVGVAIFAMRS
jgi:hypothetical protein